MDAADTDTLPTLTLPPTGTAPEPAWLDSHGAIGRDHWPAFLRRLQAAGWSCARIAQEFGAPSRRVVERWVAGSRVPSLSVRRLAWRALAAPVEAEAMPWLRARYAALQGAPRDTGGGGVGKAKRGSVVGHSPALPASPPALSRDELLARLAQLKSRQAAADIPSEAT